jgi:tetratricopeptide (TPR) repeat protein
MKLLIAAAMLFFLGWPALAEHPIEVQRYSAEGDHFKALVAYERLAHRKTTPDTRLAAARSAWALSLPKVAIQRLDELLRESDGSRETKIDALLLHGVVDYQEGKFAEAVLYAEKAVSMLKTPSPLRARAYLLWGQSLNRMRAYGAALEKLEEAAREAAADDLPEIAYQQGRALLRISRYDRAREAFERIPLGHERTSFAIRSLGEIALELENWESARFWLAKGRTEYADLFIDSWVDFGLVKALVSSGRTEDAKSVLDAARAKYPPGDPWLVLAESTYETSFLQSKEGDSL